MAQPLSCSCSSMQVTRDKLLREHMYCEKVDVSSETGSGYPGGMLRLLQGCLIQHVSTSRRVVHIPDFNDVLWQIQRRRPGCRNTWTQSLASPTL